MVKCKSEGKRGECDRNRPAILTCSVFAMVAYKTEEDQWRWVLDYVNATVETLGCLFDCLNMSEKHSHDFSLSVMCWFIKKKILHSIFLYAQWCHEHRRDKRCRCFSCIVNTNQNPSNSCFSTKIISSLHFIEGVISFIPIKYRVVHLHCFLTQL